MKIRTVLSYLLLCGIVAACADPKPAPAQSAPIISPQDFVLLPCGPGRADRPCALIVAGGKRILIGAPAGISSTLSPVDWRHLDAVIVFSLRAHDLEGLDEVRNESWRAGRETPLLTIGPRGILETVDALNKAFEQADALRIVEQGIPPGGYDAAILLGREASGAGTVFDTGDVRIEPLIQGYRVLYNQEAVLDLYPCGATNMDASDLTDLKSVRVYCDASEPDLSWPLGETQYIIRRSGS